MDDKVYNKEEDNLLLKDKSFKPCDNYMSSLEKLATVEERFIKEYTAFEQKKSARRVRSGTRNQFATVEQFKYMGNPKEQEATCNHLVLTITPKESDMVVMKRIAKQIGK